MTRSHQPRGPGCSPAATRRAHESRFRLLEGEESRARYRFHTHTAQHSFRRVCGIYPFHRKRVAPDFYGVDVACPERFDATGIRLRATIGAGMS